MPIALIPNIAEFRIPVGIVYAILLSTHSDESVDTNLKKLLKKAAHGLTAELQILF